MNIQPAVKTDLPEILAILNHYVETHHCTFDTQPWSVDQKKGWFDSLDGQPHVLLVARDGDAIVGYAHSGPFRPKVGYATTAETTVYVHPDHGGKGIGRRLMVDLLHCLEGGDLHQALAIICQPNEASNHLHEALGYRPAGTLHEIGRKFGRYWDTTYYLRRLDGARSKT